VRAQLIVEAPLPFRVGNHETLAVSIGQGNPEADQFLAVLLLDESPVLSRCGGGKRPAEFCGQPVRLDSVVDTFNTGRSVLTDLADYMGQVLDNVYMRFVGYAALALSKTGWPATSAASKPSWRVCSAAAVA
jgi:hypothetical protein